MRVDEGQRVRLTGRAWGYENRNREVYARITFADGAYAKIDEQEVLVSGSMVNGYEFEVMPFAAHIENSIKLGIEVEWRLNEWEDADEDDAVRRGHIKPGTLSDAQISWLASWLAGEGFKQ